ncbi:hypothetical protein LY13_004637 [Prauserella aidingensis]|uniref:hypothetical protein n=1 Tax=Prauserella aidingensis TaxID=387890 RepID=UPI0020A35093|nr:hypothetical protein [Prauserella aidingensis]MCP2255855.1 hypothetical protein [Prauserella aidingensis]
MIDPREASEKARRDEERPVTAGPSTGRTVLRFACGVLVAVVGLYLAIGSDNPIWLSVAQVVVGAAMAVVAVVRHRRRPRTHR